MKVRILFVDDEENLLFGLKRMLRPMRSTWDMHFAIGGKEALELLGKSEFDFDVIVSDMRMPGMSGAELLQIVQKRYPTMIRIVLSGQIDKEVGMQAMHVANYCLWKPCEPEQLKLIIMRSYKFMESLGSERLKKMVSQMITMPCRPDLYNQLKEALNSEKTDVGYITSIVEKDVAITAKVLQLVNSAFFGISRHITQIPEAVSMLGIDLLRKLVNTEGIFVSKETIELGTIKIDELWEHSFYVANLARQIAASRSDHKGMIEGSYLAGLLHDVGRLIQASDQPEEFRRSKKIGQLYEQSVLELERRIFGTDHSTIGATLIGLWGFQDPLIEAVRYHHRPWDFGGKSFRPLTAVYMADCLVTEFFLERDNICDCDYINSIMPEAEQNEMRTNSFRYLEAQSKKKQVVP